MAKFYMASLVRGSTYVANGTFYRKENPPAQITKVLKEYLERTAVDDLAIPDGNGGTLVQKLQKFTFTEVVDEDDVPKKPRKATTPTKAETPVKEEAEESEDATDETEEDDKEEATKEDTEANTDSVKTTSRSRS